MRNNIYIILATLFLFTSFPVKSNSEQQFNFDVTNVEILDEGNLFKGTNKGKITTDNGIEIIADSFEYNKAQNILNAQGSIKIEDKIQKYIIFTDNLTYFKNSEIIFTKSNSKATSDDGKIIIADDFKYEKNKNIINAQGNVKFKDKVNEYNLFSEKVTYFKNKENIISDGKTNIIIKSKYDIVSKNVSFFIKEKIISSKKKTVIRDDGLNVYNLDSFLYLLDEEEVKGNNIVVISNFGLPKSDKYFFKNGIINLRNKNFFASDVKVEIHNDIFENANNNPRLKGVSLKKIGNVTSLKKAIFTSCNENQKCPSWSIKAKEIKHDKLKKQLIYDKAILKIYDFPILYFPKFFHPDPSVERQSGFLKPEINNSNILGSSLTLPYFYAKSKNKDFTFTPSIFDKNIQMFQTEFREVGKNHNLVTAFSLTKGYKSSSSNKKKNLNHFFGEFDLDLKLDNFLSSKFYLSSERVSNDTYLKIFDGNISNNKVKPKNFDVLTNELKVFLDHQEYDFETGFQSFEDLTLNKSERYQYVLPYYIFNKVLSKNIAGGSLSLSSNGINELKDTNNLKTRVINDISYKGFDFVTNFGVKNNLNLNFKNLNSVATNDSKYKSSPQLELMSNLEITSTIPLIKEDNKSVNYIVPKVSLRLNPGDMKNYSSSLEKKINIDNIFSENRLGITDSFEAGRSITLGIDYKKESLTDINKYFEMKLATVVRDKSEETIPTTSTINRKSSNLFGSISNNFSKNLEIDYNFAIDNDLQTFEYNDVQAKISLNNFITEFNFIEESGEIGDNNIIENSTSYSFDKNNYIKFNTRRNRKLNLTEFYDLVYEYKNDCLIAGIKYKKTYYEDRDLKPSEDLFFSVTIVPITKYEYKVNQ